MQIDLLVQQGNNLETNHELVRLDQWGLRFGFAATNSDSISISGQCRQVEGKILDSHLSARGLTRLLLKFGEYVVMEPLTAKREIARDPEDDDESYKTHCDRSEFPFPSHKSSNEKIQPLKSLPQSDVELSSPHSPCRVQVSSDIKANWPNRGCVSHP